jgi:hypothetical protein
MLIEVEKKVTQMEIMEVDIPFYGKTSYGHYACVIDANTIIKVLPDCISIWDSSTMYGATEVSSFLADATQVTEQEFKEELQKRLDKINSFMQTKAA